MRGVSNVNDFLNGKTTSAIPMVLSVVGILIGVVTFIFLARYANQRVEAENTEHKKGEQEALCAGNGQQQDEASLAVGGGSAAALC